MSSLVSDDYLESDHSEPDAGSFGKPSWFDKVKAEYWACREGVCLIDMSTFAKFELRVGPPSSLSLFHSLPID